MGEIMVWIWVDDELHKGLPAATMPLAAFGGCLPRKDATIHLPDVHASGGVAVIQAEPHFEISGRSRVAGPGAMYWLDRVELTAVTE